MFCFDTHRIGASHIEAGKPCQDYSVHTSVNGFDVAIISDGHGNSRHFRSDIGAKLACETARECIIHSLPSEYCDDMEEIIGRLKKDILSKWKEAVLSHLEEYPFTEEELKTHENCLKEPIVVYGATLVAAVKGRDYWLGMQLGDGLFTHVGENGKYTWPMPESLINEGNRTASLCMTNPIKECRHVCGKDEPLALMVCSDGIEKSFRPESEQLTKTLFFLLTLFYRKKDDAYDEAEAFLDRLTALSTPKDDMSIAGILNTEKELCKPSKTAGSVQHELRMAEKQLEECVESYRISLGNLRNAEENDPKREERRKICLDMKGKMHVCFDNAMDLYQEYESISETGAELSEIMMLADEILSDEPEELKINGEAAAEENDEEQFQQININE